MMGEKAKALNGFASVHVTEPGVGLSVDEITSMCVGKLIFVGPEVPPAIRDQAVAFKEHIRSVVRSYLLQAKKSERTTSIGVLNQAGFHDAAELLRKL